MSVKQHHVPHVVGNPRTEYIVGDHPGAGEPKADAYGCRDLPESDDPLSATADPHSSPLPPPPEAVPHIDHGAHDFRVFMALVLSRARA